MNVTWIRIPSETRVSLACPGTDPGAGRWLLGARQPRASPNCWAPGQSSPAPPLRPPPTNHRAGAPPSGPSRARGPCPAGSAWKQPGFPGCVCARGCVRVCVWARTLLGIFVLFSPGEESIRPLRKQTVGKSQHKTISAETGTRCAGRWGINFELCAGAWDNQAPQRPVLSSGSSVLCPLAQAARKRPPPRQGLCFQVLRRIHFEYLTDVFCQLSSESPG